MSFEFEFFVFISYYLFFFLHNVVLYNIYENDKNNNQRIIQLIL